MIDIDIGQDLSKAVVRIRDWNQLAKNRDLHLTKLTCGKIFQFSERPQNFHSATMQQVEY